MKKLLLLLLVTSCTDVADRPPDVALRDVRISFVHAPPDWIRERGFAMHLARSSGDQTLAFSDLRRFSGTCVVTLPYPDSVSALLYNHLRTHEVRHCHGEQHRETHFQDEEPF